MKWLGYRREKGRRKWGSYKWYVLLHQQMKFNK